MGDPPQADQDAAALGIFLRGPARYRPLVLTLGLLMALKQAPDSWRDLRRER